MGADGFVCVLTVAEDEAGLAGVTGVAGVAGVAVGVVSFVGAAVGMGLGEVEGAGDGGVGGAAADRFLAVGFGFVGACLEPDGDVGGIGVVGGVVGVVGVLGADFVEDI